MFQIFVKSCAGNTISLSVEDNDTIAHVIAEFQRVEELAASPQSLTFAGKSLVDDATIAECGIKKGATLFCTSRLRGGMMEALPEKVSSQLPVNKEGEVTRDEWDALFVMLDKDNDDCLTRKEWT